MYQDHLCPPLQGFSDASATGLAGYVTIGGDTKIAYKNFTSEEAQKSSTWREIEAIRFSVLALKQYVSGKPLIWHTDNYAASLIVKAGSRRSDLQGLSEVIFDICKLENIQLEIRWIPRECITYVDGLSKQPDYDDWETTQEFLSS